MSIKPHAAGVLVCAADTCRFLFGLRSTHVQAPLSWSLIAGSCDPGEEPARTALRELREETGYDGPCEMTLMRTDLATGFTTYVATIPSEFAPQGNWEHIAFQWCPFGEWPTPLHPGMKETLSAPSALKAIGIALMKVDAS